MSDPGVPEPGRPAPARSELAVRVASAAVLAPAALAGAWFGGWPFAIGVGAVAIVVFLEWTAMAGRPSAAGLAAHGALLALAIAAAGAGMPTVALALVAAGALAGAAAGASWLSGGVLFSGLFGVALVGLRHDPSLGFAAVVFVFAVVWASDTAAYFAGRAIGGPKLWPRVSPKKTWAGSAGGLLGALAAGLAAAAILGVPTGAALVVVALALSLAAQAGDLLESAVKRRFGVKDAGRLIPGHGGLLDRVDGLAAAAVAAMALGWLRAGPEALGRGLLVWPPG